MSVVLAGRLDCQVVRTDEPPDDNREAANLCLPPGTARPLWRTDNSVGKWGVAAQGPMKKPAALRRPCDGSCVARNEQISRCRLPASARNPDTERADQRPSCYRPPFRHVARRLFVLVRVYLGGRFSARGWILDNGRAFGTVRTRPEPLPRNRFALSSLLHSTHPRPIRPFGRLGLDSRQRAREYTGCCLTTPTRNRGKPRWQHSRPQKACGPPPLPPCRRAAAAFPGHSRSNDKLLDHIEHELDPAMFTITSRETGGVPGGRQGSLASSHPTYIVPRTHSTLNERRDEPRPVNV